MATVIRQGRGIVLVHQGYTFKRNQTRANGIYWKCTNPTSQSRLSTAVFNVDPQNNAGIIIRNESPHNHASNQDIINRQVFINAIREDIVDDPTQPIRRVYDHQLVQHRNMGVLPTYAEVQSILSRERHAQLPPIPQNMNNVVIQGEWARTFNNDLFLLHHDAVVGISVFATDADLRMLRRCQWVYMDGTFKTAPHPYVQYFTIHGMLHGHVIKFASALIGNKNQNSYQRLLQVLKIRIVNLTGQNFDPQAIVVDFEGALVGAIEIEFPNSELFGCYFHFNKAVWKHVMQLGLVQGFHGDASLKKLIKKLMPIGFLPLNQVLPSYTLLRARGGTGRLIRRFPNLANFLTYFEDTWVNDNARFPRRMWNVNVRPMEYRTNNHVESFHSRWNADVGVAHPNLWVFIRKMKNNQIVTENTVAAVQLGRPAPRRARKWRLLEARIDVLKIRLANNNITIDQFWRSIRHTIAQF